MDVIKEDSDIIKRPVHGDGGMGTCPLCQGRGSELEKMFERGMKE